MSTMPAEPASPTSTESTFKSPTLESLMGESPDFIGAVLVTRQGAVVSTSGAMHDVMLRLAPFAVGLLELTERAADEAGHGDFGVMLVESTDGHIGLHAVDETHILFALASRGASMGLLRHDLSAAARQLVLELR